MNPEKGLPPVWFCPKCRRRFATRNQSHACARHELWHHFRGKDKSVRELYTALRYEIEQCGRVTVISGKTRIAFKVRTYFAQVTPRASWIDGHLVLARAVRNPRFFRIDTISPRRYVHHFRLTAREQVDGELSAWLHEAYSVGAQEHS